MSTIIEAETIQACCLRPHFVQKGEQIISMNQYQSFCLFFLSSFWSIYQIYIIENVFFFFINKNLSMYWMATEMFEIVIVKRCAKVWRLHEVRASSSNRCAIWLIVGIKVTDGKQKAIGAPVKCISATFASLVNLTEELDENWHRFLFLICHCCFYSFEDS